MRKFGEPPSLQFGRYSVDESPILRDKPVKLGLQVHELAVEWKRARDQMAGIAKRAPPTDRFELPFESMSVV